MPKSLKVTLFFLLVVVCSYLVRDMCYQREAAKISKDIELGLHQPANFIPFLVESSMMYSYAQDIASGKGIPKFDDKLTGMAKVPVNQQFTNGLEYVLGYTYRWKNSLLGKKEDAHQESQFEDDPDFAAWCRVNIRIWAGIVSGLIFLWLISLRMPLTTALFGGFLHAFSSAAIARYTGQDIVRGNFALPLIVGTFVLAYVFLSHPKIWKLIVFGLVAFLALATWDMTQIVFAIWGIAEIVRLASQSLVTDSRRFNKRRQLWLALVIATVFAAFIVPYHRIHMLIVSPLMLIVFPIIFIMQYFGQGELKRRLGVLGISLVGLYVLWLGIISLGSFGGNYGHFASLMKAKIQFLNVKPTNPELLDFDARSIWVPAMHSANRYIFTAFFPLAFNITIVMLLLTLRTKKMRQAFVRQLGVFNFPLIMFIFYGLGFFLIVRYHVFVIIFISILLPLMFHLWARNIASLSKKELIPCAVISLIYFTVFNVFLYNKLTPKIFIFSALMPVLAIAVAIVVGLLGIWLNKLIRKKAYSRDLFLKTALMVFVIITLISELDRTIEQERAYEQYLFAETAGLIKWFRQENMEDEVVMADFHVSPLLKAYCKSKIILQPKFELGKTRKDYRRFMDIMFHQTEKELAEFCHENNARIFIFDRGYPHTKGIYSPRYIAAAVAEDLKANTPANMMDTKQNRDQLRNFYWIRPPKSLSCISNRYIVFKVITETDKKMAARWVKAAEAEYRKNNLPMAARLVRSAIFADPLSPEAYLLYRQLFKRPPNITLRGF